MAAKKKVKRITRKPLIKQLLPKVTPKATAKRKTVKRRDRRAAPRPAFLGSIVALQSPDGRWAVHISTNPEEPLDRLVVSVNGRSVWEGQP